eukprot:322021_1
MSNLPLALYKVDKLIHALDEESDKNNKNMNDNNEKIESKEIEKEIEEESSTDDITIDSIKTMISRFVNERDWEQYHTPRNLLLALVGEIGELSEIFQWKGEVKAGLPSFDESDRIHLGEEMADCLIYLCRLADVCNVNLKHAVIDKMEKNSKKYPANVVKGSAKKYTYYANNKK